jgi:hypothetical protein
MSNSASVDQCQSPMDETVSPGGGLVALFQQVDTSHALVVAPLWPQPGQRAHCRSLSLDMLAPQRITGTAHASDPIDVRFGSHGGLKSDAAPPSWGPKAEVGQNQRDVCLDLRPNPQQDEKYAYAIRPGSPPTFTTKSANSRLLHCSKPGYSTICRREAE